MKKPHVLFVGAFPPPDWNVFGGQVTVSQTLMDSSFPNRVDLDLIDSTQVSNPAPGFFVRSCFAMRRLIKFIGRIERQRPDAVVLLATAGASLVEKGAMAWYARLRGVPSLIFPRGGILITHCQVSHFSRIWIRLALRGSEVFLCQGPSWHRFAVDVIGFRDVDAPIIPNWTATENLLALGRCRSNATKTTEPIRLLFVGWLENKKGIFDLLQACAKLAQDNDFVLDIAGKGNAETSVKEFVAANGLIDRVRFLGWVQGSEREVAYAKADIFVLPSWGEGLPNAMIEAMAAGIGVVVTSVGNIPDYITNGKQALLIPPKDVDALTDALDQIINDRELRASLAARGHAFAAETFSVEPAVDKLEKAVLSAIDRRGIPKSN